MAGWRRRVAEVAVRAARRAGRALPAGVRRRIDDRVFYAVFNLTRVTNDAYGWRPPEGPPDDGAPPPEEPG